jgi:hypothetical protein
MTMRQLLWSRGAYPGHLDLKVEGRPGQRVVEVDMHLIPFYGDHRKGPSLPIGALRVELSSRHHLYFLRKAIELQDRYGLGVSDAIGFFRREMDSDLVPRLMPLKGLLQSLQQVVVAVKIRELSLIDDLPFHPKSITNGHHLVRRNSHGSSTPPV